MENNQHITFIGDDLKELFTSIHCAQRHIKGAIRDSKNPHFKNEYASLEAVIDAVKPKLMDQDLFLTQHMGPMIDGKVSLTTMIGHMNGTAMISTATISRGRGQGDQADGSSISYLRRYTIAALLMVPVIDDDGTAANAEPPPRHHPSWSKDYKRFMAEANRVCELKKGEDLMEYLVKFGESNHFSNRPSQMDQNERNKFMDCLKEYHLETDGVGYEEVKEIQPAELV